MLKRKLSTLILAATITNLAATPASVFAETLVNESNIVESNSDKEENKSKKANITKFDLYGNKLLESYNEVFKMNNSNIESISNNGGVYQSSILDKAIDGNFQTHWETGKENSSSFTNEVIINLKESTTLNRIVYAARPDAGGKGFAEEFEVYASNDNSDDFKLVATGEYKDSTRDVIEIKFDSTEFKRIKFVFKKANKGWASASEFMFYKEDEIIDKMRNLFTDDTMSQVSSEFSSLEKINALDKEVKNHPLYSDFKEDLENAMELLNQQKIEPTTATTKQFEHYSNEEYSKLFKIDKDKIEGIKNNGKHYSGQVITNAIDDNLETYWETNTTNTSEFTNEVEVEFKETVELDRVVYGARKSDNKGFATEFEIYGSTTSKGDTYQLVATGRHNKVSGLVEAKFNPTEFRRIKFKFKNSDQNWATLSEIAFYKKDDISDKFDRLFTDSTMSKVSEEFNTADKVNALEEEAKKHPLYESFKESLVNARELLSQQKIEPTTATTKQFKHYSNEEYSKLFKIDKDKIEGIKNNGKHYSGQVITNAIDDNLETYWETNTTNTSEFTNEVEVEFKETVELDRVVYGARKSDNKGFATEFEIYGSTTSKGDTYQLVATGRHNKVSGLVEAKFNPTKFRRIKFKFKNSDQNWATLSEIAFYKKDDVSDKVDKLFTNGLMNELKTEYNSMEAISKIEEEINEHPLKENLKINIEIAKDILNNVEINNESIVTASQRGDANSQARKYKIARTSFSLETFGRYVVPGETIQVFVDADEKGVMPNLVLGQLADGRNGWVRRYSLSPGLNTITAPSYNDMKPAVVYIENGALPNEQAYAPRVRLVGGTAFPVYYHGKTTPEEFERELEKYVEKISTNDDDFENGVPKNVVYNVAELVSENNTISTSAAGALRGIQELKSTGKTVSDTMDEWEIMWKEFQKISGNFENSTDPTKFYNAKFTSRVFTKGPYGWSDWGYTGYNGGNSPRRDGGFFKDIVKPFSAPGNDAWAYFHEWGHNINNSSIEQLEVTNNIYSVIMRKLINNSNDDRVDWDSLYKRFSGEKVNHGYWTYLGVLEQVQYYYGEDSYAKASNIATINPDGVMDGLGSNLERLVVALSLATETDLTTFFEEWGYVKATDKMKEKVSHLSKPNVKLEYMNTIGRGYEGDGFSEDAKVDINSLKINKENREISLTFDIDDANKDASMGYEILRDGEVVGYTTRTSFVDKNIDVNKNYTYEIVAYDKKLNPLESEEISSFTPSMSIKNDKITLGLREEFDPMDYIKVLDYEGNDIVSNVEVTNNVDTSKKGVYQVKYKINDEGIVVEKGLEVEVVSEYDYASDLQEVSSKVGSNVLRKDKYIKGGTITFLKDGSDFTYSKGIGAHANSEVVYNIENKGYDYFESYIGVDQSVKGTAASVTFEVWVDGEKKFDSKVFKHDTDSEYVRVDVSGAKEVKLITTDANISGNSYDHSIWADAKFIKKNSKPVINTVDKDYKLGEEVDFKANITATDVEDGDLTSNIGIISNSYEKDKLGRFEVVYRVTDSDNNVTEKKSYITVYEDFKVVKSKFGQFNSLNEYNEQFKIPVVSITNNAGNYGNSKINNAIDGNINTYWETNKENSNSFKNEVIVDLGEAQDISKMAYAARRDAYYKGFANKFEVYVSSEAEGDNFILAGKGEYTSGNGDVVEFPIERTNVRRVKFKFIGVNENWASLSEIAFYKSDELADKITKELFTNSNKNEVSEAYNTLEKLNVLREEVSTHPASELFQADLNRAEEIIRASFPLLNIPKSISTKVGMPIEIYGEYSANDKEDGDLTANIEVTGEVNFSKAGSYELTYKVTDSDGNTTIKTRTVAVVDMNDYTYLTEYDWKSTNNSYTAPRKNVGISGKALRLTNEKGQEVSYEKGIGAHSTSTIVYDLSDKNYAYFTSYVGVDRQMYGTVGSVSFEVWVDGEKKFDSKLMNSKDSQKYVEVDINGAKELKLVVTDGGNGNGSDHGVWGDAKLHFANNEGIEINTAQLDELIANINNLNKESYTEESYNNLKVVLDEVNAELANGYTQEEVDNLFVKLNEAYEKLEEDVDLSQVIEIPDSYLKNAIKTALNIASDDITIGDMYKLTELNANGHGISNLEGLQYAKNLETLNLDYNEIKDLSQLKELEKLSNLQVMYQNIVGGTLKKQDNKVTIEFDAINKNGEKLNPTQIIVRNNKTLEDTILNIEECIDENGVVSFDTTDFDAFMHTVYVGYEDTENNYIAQVMYMFDNR